MKKEIIFRCPALCDRSSWTYSLIPIGDQRIKYRGYFVGGGEDPDSHAEILTKPYRADSYCVVQLSMLVSYRHFLEGVPEYLTQIMVSCIFLLF